MIETKNIIDSLHATAEYILSVQTKAGAIPWYKNGKLDPWDHTEAAMGLSITGHHQQAHKAYTWLAQAQCSDGSWHASYTLENNYLGETKESDIRETNFVAYIATGVWHHYLMTRDNDFLQQMYPCIQAAMHFILAHQSIHGEIAWAVRSNGDSENDALITACSSILRSIDCACKIAQALNNDFSLWQNSANRLKHALKHKPERFDRTWESKARFSMDWYYPILAGIYTQQEAQVIIDHRWSEFVVADLGCRCVNDEPWVTMAETCELVMALIASGCHKEAERLYKTLHQWKDIDGGYWTGYVYRDKAIWPAEKTTWTAGAVILASDALFKFTPAADIFTQTLSVSLA